MKKKREKRIHVKVETIVRCSQFAELIEFTRRLLGAESSIINSVLNYILCRLIRYRKRHVMLVWLKLKDKRVEQFFILLFVRRQSITNT